MSGVLGLGLAPEALQQSRPAAVDVLAHLLAWLGTHLLELAMLQLDSRGIRAFSNEVELYLRADRVVGLPL